MPYQPQRVRVLPCRSGMSSWSARLPIPPLSLPL